MRPPDLASYPQSMADREPTVYISIAMQKQLSYRSEAGRLSAFTAEMLHPGTTFWCFDSNQMENDESGQPVYGTSAQSCQQLRPIARRCSSVTVAAFF